jgi:leucyl-tRNA synthetase
MATRSIDGAAVLDRPETDADIELDRQVHRLIARVAADYERWSYNTAVAACMEMLNTLYRYVQSPGGACAATLDFAVDSMLTLLAPMVPHITAELWERRHPDTAPLHSQHWPAADPDKVKVDTTIMVVQVNGKVRDRLTVANSLTEEEAVEAALGSERVREALAGRKPSKVIARPPKLVNIVL